MPVSLVEVNEFLRDYAAIFSIITFAIGLFLGNWQALGRDRRKEFLLISAPIHDVLIAQLACEGNDIFSSRLKDEQLNKLRSHYIYGSWRNRTKCMGYDNAVQEYKKCGKVETIFDEYNYSTHIYPDVTAYRNAIKNLLRYTPIK